MCIESCEDWRCYKKYRNISKCRFEIFVLQINIEIFLQKDVQLYERGGVFYHNIKVDNRWIKIDEFEVGIWF